MRANALGRIAAAINRGSVEARTQSALAVKQSTPLEAD
jgi:hypothetical protein